MQPVKLAGVAAVAAEAADDLAVLALQDPHHVVDDVADDEVFLLRVAREMQRAGRTAFADRTVDKKLLDEFALLGEDLDAVAAAVADVDHAVVRNMRAVHRVGE